jgi:hypothetical protein
MSFLSRLLGRSAPAPRPLTSTARAPLVTDNGMWAVWDHARFAHVTSYETWEPELLEDADLLRHIEAGALVPIGIGGDGSFEFEVRVGSARAPAELSDRERRYLTVSSEPYRLVTAGKAFVSGIEYIHADPEPHVLALQLEPGTCAVTIHMIEWDAEPGTRDASGAPGKNALPDFVVLVNPAVPGTAFRREVQTFPTPA